MVWRMIRSRSRPPPRGPLRISGETRAATPSKNAQQARNSVIPRSSSASPIGPCSVAEGEKEMPQKSVEPVPTLSSTISRAPALFLSVWFGDGLLYAVDGEGVDAVVQVAASVGDVGSAGQSVGVECQIAETRQSPRRGTGALLGVVFPERHIACPM